MTGVKHWRVFGDQIRKSIRLLLVNSNKQQGRQYITYKRNTGAFA